MEVVPRRILARYTTNLQNYNLYGRTLYRTKEERSQMLKTCKATWFRKEGATSTIMVPFTKDSKLAKMVKDVIQNTGGPRGCSVKVMERPGNKINLGLSNNDPFKRTHFDRKNCPLAASG